MKSFTSPSSPTRPRPGSRRGGLIGLVLLGLVWAVTGCSTLMDTVGVGDSGGESETASEQNELIEYETWYEGSLHCATGECENTYRLFVRRPGVMRVQIFAPYGGESADFDMVLTDREGNVIARPANPRKRPRTIDLELEPGEYHLAVRARGQEDGRLKYDLLAEMKGDSSDQKPKKKKVVSGGDTRAKDEGQTQASSKSGKTGTEPTAVKEGVKPASKPKPVIDVSSKQPNRIVVARLEVLGFEEDDGERFVLLDGDQSGQVEKDMKGELLSGGERIGELLIVEVYPDGSRGVVIGDLTSEIGFDAVAEILR